MSDTRFIPNSFQTPNAIIDVLMPLLTDSEFRVLMFMVRDILGWESSARTRQKHISQSVIADGRTWQDEEGNTHSKPGCGLSLNTVRGVIKSLIKYRIIKKVGEPTQRGQKYELCLITDAKPDLVSLKLRADSKANKAKKRTQKARKVNPKNEGGISPTDTPVNDSEGISPTDTPPISPTDTRGISPTDDNETQLQTHIETNTLPAPDADSVSEDDSDTSDEKLSGEQHKQFMTTLEAQFKLYSKGRAYQVYHQLRGTAKKGKKSKWYEYGALFREQPVTPDELTRFVAWYKTENPNINLPMSADKLEDWFGKYRAKLSKPIVDKRLHARKLPVNIDMLESA